MTKPFVLFVSSLWPYKNCDGLLRAWALARAELGDRQLAIVGAGRDEKYARLAALARGRARHRRGRGLRRRGPARGDRALLPGRRRVRVPVAQRDLRAAHPGGHGLRLPGRDLGHQRHAGDRRAAPRSWPIPKDPASIARAIVEAAGPDRDRLRDLGLRRAGQFTWGATAASTLDVYREAAERRRQRRK